MFPWDEFINSINPRYHSNCTINFVPLVRLHQALPHWRREHGWLYWRTPKLLILGKLTKLRQRIYPLVSVWIVFQKYSVLFFLLRVLVLRTGSGATSHWKSWFTAHTNRRFSGNPFFRLSPSKPFYPYENIMIGTNIAPFMRFVKEVSTYIGKMSKFFGDNENIFENSGKYHSEGQHFAVFDVSFFV